MTSKRAWLVAEMVERRVAVLVLLVDQHRMALREGAALARPGRTAAPDGLRCSSEPKASASAVAQSMPSPGLDRLAAVVEEALDGAVDVEVLAAPR